MTSSPLAFEALRVHGVRSRSAFEEAVEATGSRLFEVTGSKPLARHRKLVHFNARVALVSLYLYISISLYLSISLSLYLYISISLYLYISTSLYLYISISLSIQKFCDEALAGLYSELLGSTPQNPRKLQDSRL